MKKEIPIFSRKNAYKMIWIGVLCMSIALLISLDEWSILIIFATFLFILGMFGCSLSDEYIEKVLLKNKK